MEMKLMNFIEKFNFVMIRVIHNFFWLDFVVIVAIREQVFGNLKQKETKYSEQKLYGNRKLQKLKQKLAER